uniref:NADH-ubiquinone oxidoreductase chain 2 n=1 Tax=Macrogyropus costalimai TaxID=1941320 RepID=A0A7S5WYI7_9NEOP|nr:NADH dehydrogenase subunit 2 [Macrogyropus costalimai]
MSTFCMMKMFTSYVVFFIVWIFLSLSSFSFFTMKYKLEIMWYIFMSLLVSNQSLYLKSKGFMYFVVHICSSSLLLYSISFLKDSTWFDFLIFVSLYVKMGGYPVSMWMFKFVENLSWKEFYFFLSLVKVIPLSFFIMITPLMEKLAFFLSLSSIGMIHVFRSDSVRQAILASSMVNMSWILVALKFDIKIGIIFFVMYFFWLFFMLFLWKGLGSSFSSMTMSSNSKQTMIIFFFFFFMLMGMPPTTGFFLKIIILEMLLKNSFFVESFLLFILSFIPIFIYLKFLVNYFFIFYYMKSSLNLFLFYLY